MQGELRNLWTSATFAVVLGLVGLEARGADDAAALIQQLDQKSKAAMTISDYEEIITLCKDARASGTAPQQEVYFKSLMSWAYNRRGEAFTESASDAHGRGDKQGAAEFDSKALADFDLAIQLDASRWKPWHNRGVSRAISAKYQEAIADFSKVIELNPEYANAWFNRGEIRMDIGKVAEAVADYTEAMRLDPNDLGALASRADAYYRWGKLTESLADYDEAIRIKPVAAMLAGRGDVYQGLFRWRDAAEDYREAIQLEPDSPRVLQGAAWLMATCPDVAIRDANLAIDAAEKANQSHEEQDSRYLDTLAAAYANAGRYDDAVAKINEAIAGAAAVDVPALKKRLELYRQKQPYRQETGSKTASSPVKSKR